MKTASFFSYIGAGRISIARWAPRDHPAGYRIYRPLAPKKQLMAMPFEGFDILYRKCQLGALDPRETWDRLHDLAGDAEPVILCWERPPFTADNWCHRRMVAEWFAEALAEDVPEMDESARFD